MKNFRILALFAFVLSLALTSCKNDNSATKDAARESLATTATTNTNTATPAVSPNKAAEPAVPVGPLTSISFDEESYDFGTVTEGEKVTHTYTFKNTGKEPLVISNAKGSCGCTVPEWPREPIPVGGSGEIVVKFDSKGKGKVGGQPQNKKVTITANTDPANSYITIKGSVVKPEES